MMNHNRVGPHPNIWTERSTAPRVGFRASSRRGRQEEAGYTLVALLALMTILALLAVAAAPSLQQQARREREKEAIFRGEQVAEAIRRYYAYQGTRGITGDAALPASIDQLLEGVTVGTKRVQLLRTSAARDPLSTSGDWHLVRPRSNELLDFQRCLMGFAANIRPPTNDPQLKTVELLMTGVVMPGSDIADCSTSSGTTDTFQGPFIGVSSEDKNTSVLHYYGIGHHDGWIFTPLFR